MSCEVSDKSKNGSSKADHLNTRIPYGIRPVVKVRSYTLIVFQSTHPVWDATNTRHQIILLRHISIHASRMGCDTMRISPESTSFHFNPRIPYGMRHLPCVCDIHCCKISIHASRMGCDFLFRIAMPYVVYFNPRIPYGMRLATM